MISLILIAVLLLAYSNGANDNFKGVATLFGSGTTPYRRALAWATATTLAGSALALLIAGGLVETFKGKGLVPEAVTSQPAFLVAVSLGAALTVLVATWTGLPVSTTHALTGALVGAGLLAAAGDVAVTKLASSFALPLASSPVLAGSAALLFYPAFKRVRRACGVTSHTCLCLATGEERVLAQADGTLVIARTGMVVLTGRREDCYERYQGSVFGIDVARALDAVHYLSAGAVGFARGLNDTPKIVALLIASEAIAPTYGLALVAVVMALGGVVSARRVAETMSRKITRMNAGQGLTANLVTALLVTVASRFGMPVSTTHVSVGALFGIGLVNGTASRRMIFTILAAWVTTLPLAAALGAICYRLVA